MSGKMELATDCCSFYNINCNEFEKISRLLWSSQSLVDEIPPILAVCYAWNYTTTSFLDLSQIS